MFVVLTYELDTQGDITPCCSLKMLHSKVDLGSKAEECERILTLILGEVLLY